jgi:plasmid stabilization system protein ParE
MYRIIWSRSALVGYASILKYIDTNWTSREVKHFESEVKDFLDLLGSNPKLLRVVSRNVRRGPINKLTKLTYQIDKQKKEIQILNLRSTRLKA